MTYQEIIGLINSYITTNGRNEITGTRLNTVLNEIAKYYGFDSVTVETLPAGSQATATVTNRTLNLGIPSGRDGIDATNPFKGWWMDIADLKAAYIATEGDSAYVYNGAGWDIYVYDSTASGNNYWGDSGMDVDTSNVQTFQTGEHVNQTKIVNNIFAGGEHDVASAETVKFLAEKNKVEKQLTTFVDFLPEAGNVYTYVNNYAIGSPIEVISSLVSQKWRLRRYEISPNQTYYGSQLARITDNINSNYVYYWCDEDKNILQKVKTYGNGETANYWEDFVLTPPSGARYLYVMVRNNFSDGTIVKEDTIIGANDLQEEIEELNEKLSNVATLKKTIFPIEKFPATYINRYNVDVGINVEQNIAVGSSPKYITWKYEVHEGARYKGTGRMSQDTVSGVFVYYYADENGVCVGRSHELHGVEQWDEYLDIPSGTKFIYVLCRCLDSSDVYLNDISFYKITEEIIVDNTFNDKERSKDNKKINIIVIGNSYSEDAFAYFPILMQKIAPNIDFKINILMQSSSGLEGSPYAHYNNFKDNEAVYYRSFYDSARMAWFKSLRYNQTIKGCLDKSNYNEDSFDKIDLVILQTSQGSDAFSEEERTQYINLLMQEMSKYVNYGLRFALFNGQQRASVFNNGNAMPYDEMIRKSLKSAVTAKRQNALTLSDIVIPVNAAIQNARSIEALRLVGKYVSTAANDSGYGWLQCPDGNHLDDGLGRQIAAYSSVATIMSICGKNYEGIVGDVTTLDTNILRYYNTPHPHPSTIDATGSTIVNIKLAQLCAVMAVKHPYAVFDMTYHGTGGQFAPSYVDGDFNGSPRRMFGVIETTLPAGVLLSNVDEIIAEGEDYITTLIGNFTKVRVFLGEMEVSQIVYDQNTKTIHIYNVNDNIKIKVE